MGIPYFVGLHIVLCLKPSFRTANGRLHVLFFKKSRIFWWLINYEHLNDFKNVYIKYRVKWSIQASGMTNLSTKVSISSRSTSRLHNHLSVHCPLNTRSSKSSSTSYTHFPTISDIAQRTKIHDTKYRRATNTAITHALGLYNMPHPFKRLKFLNSFTKRPQNDQNVHIFMLRFLL